ncbi:S26 family signal peptidase [Azorhizobium caulinodans]|uniref:S26 family signal peptidase n=1 Tax=Azorhizobium caulinodans TaxID=7 RepID=UPI002FBEC06E
MTRFGWIIATYVAALGAIASAFLHPLPRFIWNASASVPIGLYAVHPAGTLSITELVVVRPPQELAQFLADRRYLPKGVPMLKRVLALPGQTVCRTGRTVTVDAIAMGEALERDSRGRPLPVWQGCKRIADGQVFLMNWQSEDSLDGRYFGPLSRTTIVGRADPLWTQDDN